MPDSGVYRTRMSKKKKEMKHMMPSGKMMSEKEMKKMMTKGRK